MPAHFIPRASLAHFILLYLFYSHGLLLNLLGLLGPIIISLPLITFRAYWPLCQPHGFTNSFFFGFPNPFTSSLPLIILMGLLLHSLSFLGPFASSLSLIIFCGPVNHYSCRSDLLVFTLLFSLPIFFILLDFFYH